MQHYYYQHAFAVKCAVHQTYRNRRTMMKKRGVQIFLFDLVAGAVLVCAVVVGAVVVGVVVMVVSEVLVVGGLGIVYCATPPTT